MDVSKTSDQIQMNTKLANPSQEYPASSKPTNQDLKDVDVLYTFKVKSKSQILDHGVSKTIDHI